MGNTQLPTRDHIQPQPLLFQDESQCLIYKGFTSINNGSVSITLTKFRFELGTLIAQAKLIKDI